MPALQLWFLTRWGHLLAPESPCSAAPRGGCGDVGEEGGDALQFSQPKGGV